MLYLNHKNKTDKKMNKPTLIALNPLVNNQEAMKLKARGIEFFYLENHVIANCKTAEEQSMVKQVNCSRLNNILDDYWCGQPV